MALSKASGGYDCAFVSPPPSSLECSICLLTLRDPHVISCCGNHFCKPCITRVKGNKKPCPLCNDPDYSIMLHKGVMREVNSLAVYCAEKPNGCDWTGDLGQLQCHLNIGSRDSGCGYVLLECSYQCGEKFARRDISKHEQEECLNLPVEKQIGSLVAQMRSALSASRDSVSKLEKKVDSMNTDNQNLAARCAAIESRNEELVSQNASLELSMQELQAKANTIESEKQTLKSRVAMLESLAMKVFRLENRHTAVSNRVDELEENTTKKMEYLEVESSIAENRLTPTPPYYFTLSNFHHYQRIDYHWESDPFYSFSKGYKFHVTVYPHGTSRCRGSHLSIYVCLLRGEYDDELEWPFHGAVFIDIFNHATKSWDMRPAIEFEQTDDAKFTGRPVNTRSNPGLGFPNWMPLDEVEAHYCQNSAIRFRVAKVTVLSNVYLPMD